MSGLSDGVFLGLGGNVGDPRRAMASALRQLDARPDTRVVAVSSLYRTPPWGKADQPDFLNAAAELHTQLAARPLLEFCLEIERSLKRRRAERWGPRPIDIDVLLYKEQDIREQGLEIPHPQMTRRAFVLVPLAEIAPGLIIAGEDIASHLARLDTAAIEKVTDGGDWWKEG